MMAATTHWPKNYKIGYHNVNSTDIDINNGVMCGVAATYPQCIFWALTSSSHY